MSTQARLWMASPADSPDADRWLLERLADRPLALVVHVPGGACAALGLRLAERSQGAPRALAELARADAAALACLSLLAAECAGRELAVITATEVLSMAAAVTLGLDLAGPGLALRPGSLGAFNWPAAPDPGARSELLGLDLDWLPPVRLDQPRSRFPGGPGVAGTSR